MHPPQQDVEHRYHNRLLSKKGCLNWKLQLHPNTDYSVRTASRRLIVDPRYWPSHTHMLDRGVSMSAIAKRMIEMSREKLLEYELGFVIDSSHVPLHLLVPLLSVEDILKVLKLTYYSAFFQVVNDNYGRQQAALVKHDNTAGFSVAIINHSDMQFVYDAVSIKLCTFISTYKGVAESKQAYSFSVFNRHNNYQHCIMQSRRIIDELYRLNLLHKLEAWQKYILDNFGICENEYAAGYREVGILVRSDSFDDEIRVKYSIDRRIKHEPLRN